MPKKYDTLVFIGRFQPLHDAHLEIIKRATALTDRLVIVVGSAYQPRTFKNPFTSADRDRMLRDVTFNLDIDVRIEHNIDSIYNDQTWAMRVQEAVNKHTLPGSRVGIIGHKKDESSFYLDMFPQWTLEDVPLIQPLDATSVRDLYFRDDVNMRFIQGVVPRQVFNFLEQFRLTPEYEQVIRERKFVETYKKQFASLPYPPTFVTTDAVVIQSGHVLMIERKAEPGKGLMALPGGFLNAGTDRSLIDAMLRELKEETGIKVPGPVLKGSIVGNQVFDAIGRSARGRTITHAYKIVLQDGPLPKVKGSDDAAKAFWVPLGELHSEYCFEDHYEIIQHFVGA